MLSLAAIKKRSSTVVMQPLTTGEVITWRVYLLDPQDARRVPWLMDKVLRSASPQVDPDADPFAALEAEVARDGKSVADLEAEQLLECQRIACETAFEVQGLDEEDAAAWDPVRLVLDVDEQADAELGEDGTVITPTRLHVGFLDRVTIQAVAYAATSRLEVAASATAQFQRSERRRHGQPA